MDRLFLMPFDLSLSSPPKPRLSKGIEPPPPASPKPQSDIMEFGGAAGLHLSSSDRHAPSVVAFRKWCTFLDDMAPAFIICTLCTRRLLILLWTRAATASSDG